MLDRGNLERRNDPAGPSPTGAAGAGGHLDDLAAMRLADGEALPAAAAHVAGCARCATLVETFRSEAAFLTGAVALDDEEVAFLQAANLPGMASAWTMPRLWATAAGHEIALTLATLVAVAVLAALGWQAATGVLEAGAGIAQMIGGTAVLADVFASFTVDSIRFLWEGTLAIAQLPLVDSPTLPLIALAALLWGVLGLLPRVAPRLAPAANAAV